LAATTHTGRSNDPLRGTVEAELRRELDAFARRTLPQAMVPARFVVVDELPKLPNGKVDRSRLGGLDIDRTGSGQYVPPSTPTELAISRIWADVLGIGEVGVRTDFFELGGNSLTAVQVAARLRDVLGMDISVRQLFAAPTVSDLAGTRAEVRTETAGTGENPRGLPADELRVEVTLPDDVSPAGALPPVGPPYRHVLLTGGTGYTGAFLIRELLDRGVTELVVLARADDAADAARRVRDNLARYGLWRDEYADQLVGVPGDLGEPYLGLSRRDHRRLAEATELIVHNGALSSYALSYQQLRASNVLGTVEVLRLACRHRVKPVHFVSSLAVFPGRVGRHDHPEAEATEADGVVGGYRQTKWVSDALVHAAGRRGLPVSVYRPGQITGAQDTGACAQDTFLNAMIKGCIQLGAALDFDVQLEMTPVDLFAGVVAHVALGGGHGAVLHVPGERSLSWARLVDLITAYGYPLRRLPYPEWYRELTDAVRAGVPNELTRFLPLFMPDGPSADLGYEHAEPTFTTDNLRRVLSSAGLAYRPADIDLVTTYLSYFTSTGYLPEPPHGRVAEAGA
jgi:thioester reductase-like protein